MKRLGVPFFKQERQKTCGLAVLRMILAYFGQEVIEKDLAKTIPIYSAGTYTTDMAMTAKELGNFDSQAYTMNLPILGSLKLPFGTKIDRSKIRSINPRPSDRTTYKTIRNYVEKGGVIYWDYPRLEMLREWIDKDVPCIISVNTTALNQYWKHWDNGHYLIVEGYDEQGNFGVIDSSCNEDKARYIIKGDLLLAAWTVHMRKSSDYLMVIYPNEKVSKEIQEF